MTADATKPPATPAARDLRAKLERLAAQGVNGEKAAAEGKLARLLKRYDFSAPDTTTADLFAGVFARSRESFKVATIPEPDIANAVKWSFEAAAGIQCGFLGADIMAQAQPDTALRMGRIAESIATSFRALLAQHLGAGGNPLDRGNFVLGLYEGMMREERDGAPLPSRPGCAKVGKAKRKAIQHAPGLNRHPYSVAVILGRQIRFEVPLGDLQKQLERTIKGEIEE